MFNSGEQGGFTSTKEKIIQATLTLIKSEGLESVTIRKIAGLAGANIALINYHFGSKEKLISETLKILLDSFQEAFTAFDDARVPPVARLKKFLMLYTSSLLEYPELLKRILSQDTLFESQAEYFTFLKRQGFEKVSATISELTGETSREKILLMGQQIFAAIFSPITKAACQPKPDAIILTSLPVEEQIDLFLDHYFYKYTAQQAESRG